MQLIGQKNNLEIIDSWKQLPQFIIIQGGRNYGKKYLTLYLCKKFGLKYEPMKNAVKNVRTLIEYMSPGKNVLYHFDNFEDASIAAKNSLLKITEEPIPGNYIVITGGPQIKTLESRARRIIMEPYSFEEMNEYMSSIWKDEGLRQNLYIAGINTPAKVQLYKNCDVLPSVLDYAYEIFNRITYINSNVTITMIRKFEDRYDKDKEDPNKIDLCMLFLDLLINIIQFNMTQKHLYSYLSILDILIDAKNKLLREPTLRRRMLMFSTFYKIEQLQKGGM